MATGAQFSGPPSATPAAGDAGANFLAGLADASPYSTDDAKRINEGAQQFKALAENGGFAINEEGLLRYRKVCDIFLDGYDNIRHEVGKLATKAQMGSSDYARKVADFNVKVANGDEQSLIPNLELMKDGFEKAREALEIARKNYQETEANHSQSFAKLNGPES
jgi:hypothetical protein